MLTDELRGRRAALGGLFLFLLGRGVGSLGSGLLGSLQGLQLGQLLGGVDAGEDVLALVQGGVDGQRAEAAALSQVLPSASTFSWAKIFSQVVA